MEVKSIIQYVEGTIDEYLKKVDRQKEVFCSSKKEAINGIESNCIHEVNKATHEMIESNARLDELQKTITRLRDINDFLYGIREQ